MLPLPPASTVIIEFYKAPNEFGWDNLFARMYVNDQYVPISYCAFENQWACDAFEFEYLLELEIGDYDTEFFCNLCEPGK